MYSFPFLTLAWRLLYFLGSGSRWRFIRTNTTFALIPCLCYAVHLTARVDHHRALRSSTTFEMVNGPRSDSSSWKFEKHATHVLASRCTRALQTPATAPSAATTKGMVMVEEWYPRARWSSPSANHTRHELGSGEMASRKLLTSINLDGMARVSSRPDRTWPWARGRTGGALLSPTTTYRLPPPPASFPSSTSSVR